MRGSSSLTLRSYCTCVAYILAAGAASSAGAQTLLGAGYELLESALSVASGRSLSYGAGTVRFQFSALGFPAGGAATGTTGIQLLAGVAFRVPEPTMLTQLGTGLLGLSLLLRRRRRRPGVGGMTSPPGTDARRVLCSYSCP